LRESLKKNQLHPNDIALTISRLTESRVLDDTRTAIAYAHRSANVKLRGKHRTLQELQARGFGFSVASYAVETVFDEADETIVLERAIQKRLNGPIRTPTQFRKLYHALLRQGFPSEAIASALISRIKSKDSFVEE
jgi:SOS response regulatory protein OraA/RecX